MVYKLPFSAETIKHNSIFAMAAHIVVSPRFEYIVYDKNWMNDTFAYQDYENTDGAIDFSNPNGFVGLFRNPNSKRILAYPDKSIFDFFDSNDKKEIIDAVSQFMLIEFPAKKRLFHKGEKIVVPTLTTSCWSDGNEVFSLDSVDDFLLHGGNYLQFLSCDSTDLIERLRDDYEMTDVEVKATRTLYEMKLHNSKAINLNELLESLNCNETQTIREFILGFGLEMRD